VYDPLPAAQRTQIARKTVTTAGGNDGDYDGGGDGDNIVGCRVT